MTALALAILFPAMLTLVFLIVQAGIYYHAQQWAAAAADRAVARATEFQVEGGDRGSAGQSAGQSFLAGNAVCADFSVEPVAADAGRVEFVVSCEVPGPLAGWVPGASASSEGSVERFIPETERG